jgi:hypothetical protein
MPALLPQTFSQPKSVLHDWEWFSEIERQIKQGIEGDNSGLISWDLMEPIDGALESEIGDIRACSGRDRD